MDALKGPTDLHTTCPWKGVGARAARVSADPHSFVLRHRERRQDGERVGGALGVADRARECRLDLSRHESARPPLVLSDGAGQRVAHPRPIRLLQSAPAFEPGLTPQNKVVIA